MNRNTTIARPLLAVLLLSVIFGPVAALAEKTVQATLSASSTAEVSIECISGKLTIVGWNREEVEVSGTIGDDAELEISGDDGDVDIELEIPERRRGKVDVSVTLEIRVPFGASIDIESLSATTNISDTSGDVEVETMSGDVTVTGDAESVDIENVSGNIRITGTTREVDAETISGNVILENVSGEISATSVNGNIEITGASIEEGQLESVNGSIHFQGDLGADGELSVETYTGNVELILPASISASFEIETLSGTITNELSADQAAKPDRFSPGRRLEFRLGSGSATVTVENLSGNVIIRP